MCQNSPFAHTYHVGPSPVMCPNNPNSIFNLLLFIRVTLVLSRPMCTDTLQNAVWGDVSALLDVQNGRRKKRRGQEAQGLLSTCSFDWDWNYSDSMRNKQTTQLTRAKEIRCPQWVLKWNHHCLSGFLWASEEKKRTALNWSPVCCRTTRKQAWGLGLTQLAEQKPYE